MRAAVLLQGLENSVISGAGRDMMGPGSITQLWFIINWISQRPIMSSETNHSVRLGLGYQFPNLLTLL